MLASQRLLPAYAASGPYDLAVRFDVFVRRNKVTPDVKASITTPALRSVTIAKRPLMWAEDAVDIIPIYRIDKRNIFANRD